MLYYAIMHSGHFSAFPSPCACFCPSWSWRWALSRPFAVTTCRYSVAELEPWEARCPGHLRCLTALNPSTLAEAGATFGAVLEATESRKHQANDEKCSALGWVSTPLAVDSYGAWGKEASCTSCCSACNPQVPAKVTGFFRPVLQRKHLLN